MQQPEAPATPIPPMACEASFASLCETCPLAFHQIDLQGRIIYVNLTECQMLGYDRTEVIGRHIWDFVAPEERSISRQMVEEKLSGSRALEPITRTYLRSNGTHLVVEIHERLIQNPGGAIRGIATSLIDVTARHHTEESRIESELWLHATFEAINDPIVAVDATGVVRHINTAAVAAAGLDPDRTKKLDLLDVFQIRPVGWKPGPGTPDDLLKAALLEPWRKPCVLRRRDGVETIMDVQATPIRVSGDITLGAVFLCLPVELSA